MPLSQACLDRGRRPGCLGTATAGPRCASCRRAHDRERRPSPADRGYRDPDYLAAKREFEGQPCALRLAGCTSIATSPDHVVPVSRGGRGGPLQPACMSCQRRRGAKEL